MSRARRTAIGCALVVCVTGCSSPLEAPPPDRATTSPSAIASPAPPRKAPARRVISLIGTNDLHGHIESLPMLGGYLKNLRAARAADGGVLLLDGGDMFQGTLESNLNEGLAVVTGYNALGYHAAAIGNHEFDFGPIGPATTPREPGDDPRGALLAAAKAARFALLSANVLDRASGKGVTWPGVAPSTIVTIAGFPVGILGLTTKDTLRTTISGNVADLEIAPLARAVELEANNLRAKGAVVVVVAAHAGSKCKEFTGDAAKDGCELGAEIFDMVREIPKNTIDAVVAGHTHAGVAHVVEGVPVIESFSYGKAFGRVDLVVEGDPPRVVAADVEPPRSICRTQPKDDATFAATCDPGEYEGAPVVPDEAVARALAPFFDAARDKKASLLGVELPEKLRRDHDQESEVGNLFAELLLESRPGATVGIVNGGGLRAELPAGPLTYGALFEAFPFDNRVATARMTGKHLKALFRDHVTKGRGGILSIAGIRLEVRCAGKDLHVELRRMSGAAIRDDEDVEIVASDFLMTGGDEFWGAEPPPPYTIQEELVRGALEVGLRKRKTLKRSDVVDTAKRRIVLPGRRPIRC